MKLFLSLLLLTLTTCLLATNQNDKAESDPVNVVFMMADDLNDYLGVLGGHPQVKTPNLDRLAEQGVCFLNGQSNIPVCQPARNLLFTGVYSHESGDYGWVNHLTQSVIKESKTIMQLLQENGYKTYGAGKLLHDNEKDYSIWDEWGCNEKHKYGPFPMTGGTLVAHATVPKPFYDIGSIDGSYGSLDDGAGTEGWVYGWDKKVFKYNSKNDRDLTPDELIAQWGAEKLQALATANATDPFFMGIGFVRPHTPLLAPQEYFDMYPLEDLIIDNYTLDDTVDTYYHDNFPSTRKGLKYYRRLLESYGGDRDVAIKKFLQAYLACVSFMDAQVGVVLDALEASPYADNTMVIFTADHGWQMGEKNYLFKNSGWEESMRVPYIIKTPNNASVAGSKVEQPISHIDLYPTLVDYCQLTGDNKKSDAGGELGGFTLRPLLENPSAEQWDGPNGAVCIIGNIGPNTTVDMQNYSYRTADWRYILYANGNEELYNHDETNALNDPYEWYNLAYKEGYQSLKDSLQAELVAVIGELQGTEDVELYSTDVESANVGDAAKNPLSVKAPGNNIVEESDGNKYYHCTGNGGKAQIRYGFTAVAGTTYKMTADVRVPSGSGTVAIGTWEPWQKLDSNLDATWQEMEITFTPAASAWYMAWIEGDDANVVFDVDNIKVYKVGGAVSPIPEANAPDDVQFQPPVTAIDEVEDNASSLIVYPNPNGGLFTIKDNDMINDYAIFNAKGQQLMSMKGIDANSSLVDLEGYPNGIYFIHTLNALGQTNTAQFIVL